MRCRTNSAGTLALISAVVGLCLSSAAGAAAGRWTSPQRLTAGLGAGTPTLGFDGSGAALATWATAAPGAGRRSASRAPTRVAFGPSRTAPDIGEEVIEGLPPAPVIDRSGGVIAIEQRRVRPASGLATIFDLTPRFGRVNGTFARARGGWRIFSHTEPPAVALAGNTRGVAVVAWLQLRRDAHGCVNREDVRVAVRRPGGTFGAPVTLARGASSGLIAASVSSDGQLLVAWRHGPAIETRSRAQRGPWGRDACAQGRGCRLVRRDAGIHGCGLRDLDANPKPRPRPGWAASSARPCAARTRRDSPLASSTAAPGRPRSSTGRSAALSGLRARTAE